MGSKARLSISLRLGKLNKGSKTNFVVLISCTRWQSWKHANFQKQYVTRLILMIPTSKLSNFEMDSENIHSESNYKIETIRVWIPLRIYPSFKEKQKYEM